MSALGSVARDGRGARPSIASLLRALRRVGAMLAFGVAPLLLTGAILGLAVGDNFAFDFKQFWQGGRDVLDGSSPYPAPGTLVGLGQRTPLDPVAVQEIFRFPYPAPAALAMVPFAALPFPVAAGIMAAVLLACVPCSLLLVGVRDWRCHGAALATIPVISAVRLGTFTPLLLLGLAALWRWRDRRPVAAAAVVAVVLAKLFLWPLLVWLLVTRRMGTALAAVVAAVFVTVGAWAVIDFAGFADYPRLLSTLSAVVERDGYSVVALAAALELSGGAGQALAGALGAGALLGVVWLGRRGDERAAFTAAVAAAILLSPIVWLHYFALVVLPLALYRPRLSPLWLAPLAFWAVPYQESGGSALVIAFGLGAALAILGLAPSRPPWRVARAPLFSTRQGQGGLAP